MTNEGEIRERLVARGQKLLASPREPVQFTEIPAANALLNDLERYPHAYVLACVMDRQIKAEKAWAIPYQISEKLGTFSMEALAQLSRKDVKRLMSRPKPLHRFSDVMSGSFYSAVQRIANQYSRDASRIWSGKPSSAEVVYRFLEFDGIGPKIATMAVNILARSFKIPFADFFSVDVSVDRQVRRVFSRLGLCEDRATVEQIVYKARVLNPTFPGILDSPSWELGRSFCQANKPECTACYMNDLCPTAAQYLK